MMNEVGSVSGTNKLSWPIARQSVVLFIAFFFVFAMLPVTQAGGGVEHGMLITSGSAGTSRPLEAFDAVSMAAVDLNGDGVKEILAHNDNNNFYVFDGATGALIAELETNHPPGWGARVLAGPAVGDLSGNGLFDIVLTNSAGWITVFEAQPVSGPQKIQFVKQWEYYLDPHNENPNYANEMSYGEWHGHPGLDGPAFLADAHGDGRDEIFVQLDDMPGLYKLTPGGQVEWWSHASDGNSGPLVADLTGDGRLEAIYPSDGGHIHVYHADSMHHRCTFSAHGHGVWPGSISVSPSVADLTGDGRQEIVFGVRNVWHDQNDPDWIDKSNAHHFALRDDCSVLWHRSWTWNNPHVHMHPVPVDITGDGRLDVVFQDWNTIGHKPGNWEHTGPANLYAIQGHTGNPLWRVDTQTSWSNNNLAVADITGDGRPEILVNEWLSHDGISWYSLQGDRLGFVQVPGSWQVTKGPLVADLNGNGRLDLVVPVHRGASHCEVSKDIGCREGALQVYHTSSSAKPVYGNNHLLNAGVSGTSPAPPWSPPPEEPSDGSFSARFYNIRGNEWWVESNVESSQRVDRVDARVDSGAWRSLDKTGWGSWANSFQVPDGSVVQLRAMASDGSTSLSDCLRWPDVKTVSCPDGDDGPAPTPPAPGDDAVRFREPRGNEWWLETDVDADRSITAVHARIDGGQWRSLDATSWGSWAASHHAPGGTIVQFRATLDDGSTARSDCYRWTGAERTTCPGGGDAGDPDGTGGFQNVRGNEWWVETDAVFDPGLVGVQARINGGTWQDLDMTDWGSWAASLHVPDGSTVEFRAVMDDGTTTRSEPYKWLP